jgi:hypothetical protein
MGFSRDPPDFVNFGLSQRFATAVGPDLRSLRADKVEVILRPTVNRPVCRSVRHPSGTRNQFFFFFFLFIFRELRVCWCAASSLTRGRVCSLLLLLAIASAGCGHFFRRFEDVHCLLLQNYDTMLTAPMFLTSLI